MENHFGPEVAARYDERTTSTAEVVDAIVDVLVEQAGDGPALEFGIGTGRIALPLISPEKGTQLGWIAQGTLLVVSGVYYPVDVLPTWMQWLAKISPATYALEAARAAILDGQGLSTMWDEIWPLLIIGVVSIPLGLWIFARGERYAKKHGKLKRSG